MKIILLRHEERYRCPKFDTTLTQDGIRNSLYLKNKLDKKNVNIDVVYSSPYLRCLQTLYFLCDEINKKINVDYSLCEFFDDNDSGVYQNRELTIDENEYFKIEPSYKSLLNKNDIPSNETVQSMYNRIKIFSFKIF